MEYFSRYIEKQIKEALEISGGVLVAGPKTVEKPPHAKDLPLLHIPLIRKRRSSLFKVVPRLFCRGAIQD